MRATGEELGGRLRLLVGKPGLDGHSNGAEQVAVRARDAGFEVIYQGIRLTPEQIVAAAVAEDVHCVGLSILSGSHMELVPAVLDGLREAGLEDVPVIVGGIIPDSDGRRLIELGVAAVYTPKDFGLTEIMGGIVDVIRRANGLDLTVRLGQRAARPPASLRGGRPACPGRPARRGGVRDELLTDDGGSLTGPAAPQASDAGGRARRPRGSPTCGPARARARGADRGARGRPPSVCERDRPRGPARVRGRRPRRAAADARTRSARRSEAGWTATSTPASRVASPAPSWRPGCAAVLEEVAGRTPGETVLVVSHGGAMGVGLPALAATCRRTSAGTSPLPNCGVVELAVDGDGWRRSVARHDVGRAGRLGKACLSRATVPLVAKGKEQGARRRRLPKSKCCVSKSRCKRCPIRMLKEGTLPDGLPSRSASW